MWQIGPLIPRKISSSFYNAYAFRKGFVRYSSIRSGIMIAPSSCWLFSDALVILEFSSSAGVGMESPEFSGLSSVVVSEVAFSLFAPTTVLSSWWLLSDAVVLLEFSSAVAGMESLEFSDLSSSASFCCRSYFIGVV